MGESMVFVGGSVGYVGGQPADSSNGAADLAPE
jgi:hypothetical protein